MSDLIVCPAQGLRGVVAAPGDKSISHRAQQQGAVADGPSYLTNLNPGGDCRATLDCLGRLPCLPARNARSARTPQARPMTEIIIMGAHHAHNLGDPVGEYDQPRTVRLEVVLEDYVGTRGLTERRLEAYELGEGDKHVWGIGYLPKDVPRLTGRCLAALIKPGGQRRIVGKLSHLSEYHDVMFNGQEGACGSNQPASASNPRR